MSSTKTVSFRLPMDEYIKYLQKASAKSLGPADYAILKIYEEEKINEELENLKASYTRLESEYDDFKRQVRETYSIEVSKAINDLKAKYEAELKQKEVEYNKVTKQLQDLTNRSLQAANQKETINNEVVELKKELLKAEEKGKLQIQASADATVKQLKNKDKEIQELQNKLELAKQENKELLTSVKERMQKAALDFNKEKEKLKAELRAEFNAKLMKVLPEIAKDKSIFTSDKVFVDRWEKRIKEL